MEIPLANAKMRTIAVIKDFMAGLVGARAEWLWNTVTVGVLAKKEREGIHTVRDFHGVVRRPGAAAPIIGWIASLKQGLFIRRRLTLSGELNFRPV